MFRIINKATPGHICEAVDECEQQLVGNSTINHLNLIIDRNMTLESIPNHSARLANHLGRKTYSQAYSLLMRCSALGVPLSLVFPPSLG